MTSMFALPPVEILTLTKAFGERVVKAASATIAPGQFAISAAYEIRALLKKAEPPRPRRGTTRALRIVTLALLLQRLGVTRERTKTLLIEVLAAAAAMNEEEADRLLEEHPEIIEALRHVDDVVNKLPDIQAQGAVSVAAEIIRRV